MAHHTAVCHVSVWSVCVSARRKGGLSYLWGFQLAMTCVASSPSMGKHHDLTLTLTGSLAEPRHSIQSVGLGATLLDASVPSLRYRAQTWTKAANRRR